MAKPNKSTGPDARLPKGFRDIGASEIRVTQAMIENIRAVYERYGFEPLETPAIEFTDALGKFLPDQDRPNAGVFSFQDVVPEARQSGEGPEARQSGEGPEARQSGEPESWMSLRYDLTAPLARHVAENFATLPKPFRRYATGSVFRNEKPGPGRYRQFTQFDADTVGTDNIAADAEMCMLAADTLEALGIARGDYVVKVNSRKVLDGLMEANGLSGVENESRRLVVLRAIDKIDRLGGAGVALLLGKGRKDESGDFTPGAGLDDRAISNILAFTGWGEGGSSAASDTGSNGVALSNFADRVSETTQGQAGISELRELVRLCEAAGYDSDRIRIDPSCIRGLEYYTGPVFEAELTFQVKDDDGNPVRFGSVGGGGRYDDLVSRFTGEKVPATGFSIGVSRLQAALTALGKTGSEVATGPVVVLVMDKADVGTYQRLTQTLRQAGIRAEMYLGSSGMKAQMKYADKRNSPCVVIQGGDEKAKGEVTLKDLIEGAKAAAAIKDNAAWKAARPAQITVPEAEMVERVREILALHAATAPSATGA